MEIWTELNWPKTLGLGPVGIEWKWNWIWILSMEFPFPSTNAKDPGELLTVLRAHHFVSNSLVNEQQSRRAVSVSFLRYSDSYSYNGDR